jgi:hypothetical protein
MTEKQESVDFRCEQPVDQPSHALWIEVLFFVENRHHWGDDSPDLETHDTPLLKNQIGALCLHPAT